MQGRAGPKPVFQSSPCHQARQPDIEPIALLRLRVPLTSGLDERINRQHFPVVLHPTVESRGTFMSSGITGKTA